MKNLSLIKKISLKKKLSLYTFLVLIFCNTALTQSSLPECEGSDRNILEYSRKHFNKMRKWTNCHGTAMGPDGQKYVGEFSNGKFHGQGTFTHAGRKYVGQYKNHKKHGQGTYKYANGDKYVGKWKKAKYDGQGTYTYANGDKYDGKWKKGSRHGQGIFTYADGKVEEGIWKSDKLIKLKQ